MVLRVICIIYVLFISLEKILSLAVKNIEVNFMLFCSLIRIFE